jgi:acetylornithine deacetylase/succinyl-diaminopimelate desuccinylase-like protein
MLVVFKVTPRPTIFTSHSTRRAKTEPGPPGHVDAETNTIFGRGAMDDKAGVAICLGLMRVIVEQRLQFDGDLVFQFVLEDEITGNGSLACLEAGHVGDAAVILDGTTP